MKIEQTLHGYLDGHRLLQASRGFGPEATRTLSLMSDISGQGMVSGFEEYITAYPLFVERSYAVAKTWYASELSRPGCVWTHTLIMRVDDLGLIEDLQTLEELFRRPTGSDDRMAYRSPIDWQSKHWSPRQIDAPRLLIEALYAADDKAVVVPAESSQLQPLILALWSQQWPELRSGFMFCTGALGERKLSGKRFDIQVVPRVRSRQIAQRSSGDSILLDVVESTDDALHAWSEEVAQDLSENGGPFRRFVWAYSHDLTASRGTFASLAEIFVAIKGHRLGSVSESQLVNQTAERFAEKQSGSRLKRALFGPSPELIQPRRDGDVLLALLTSTHQRAYDPESLVIRERAASHWKTDKRAAAAALIEIGQVRPTRLRTRYLEGVADAVSIDDFLAMPALPSPLIGRLARRVDIIADVRFWLSLAEDSYEDALRSAVRHARSTHDRRAAALALYGANITRANRVDALACDPRFEGFFFEAINEGGEPLDQSWEDYLSQNIEKLARWLDQSTRDQEFRTRFSVLRVVVNLVDSVSRLQFADHDFWYRLVRSANREPSVEFGRVVARLFAAGLRSSTPGSCHLITVAFPHVFRLALTNALPTSVWEDIARYVARSTSWWWERDDRPHRLARTMADAILSERCQSEDFASSFETASEFWVALDQMQPFKREHVLARVRGALFSGSLRAEDLPSQLASEIETARHVDSST